MLPADDCSDQLIGEGRAYNIAQSPADAQRAAINAVALADLQRGQLPALEWVPAQLEFVPLSVEISIGQRTRGSKVESIANDQWVAESKLAEILGDRESKAVAAARDQDCGFDAFSLEDTLLHAERPKIP